MGSLCSQTTEQESHLKEFHSDETCTDSLNCEKLIRLKTILQLYNEWLSLEADNVGILEYINNNIKNEYVIVSLLQDYHHLIDHHYPEFENIYNYFTDNTSKCSMDSCSMITRNHRCRDPNTQSRAIYRVPKDRNQVITQQILDQIHCYIYHTFDMGFKLRKQEKMDIFNDNHSDDVKTDDIIFDDENIETYKRRERIGKVMQHKRRERLTGLATFDDNNKFMSNINEIQNFKQDTMFSFGVRYYYADNYKNNEELDAEYNKGYTYNHWFIDKKYPNLKAELLTNETCTMDKPQYKDLYYKSKEYLQTEHVLKNCEKATIEHLLCIMIYCNFDVLQCEFSKTYRHGVAEKDDALKRRHTEFANFGETLQEAVELNGIKVGKGTTKIFYHGINMELMFTSTLHKFCGPISTSSEYEVALVFTKNNGIILELNDGTLYTNECNSIYFDCEWLSDFGYEKEKFFIGGKVPLKIVSIFHVALNQNYGTYIKLITILLAIIEGDISLNKSDKLSERNIKAIVILLKHELEDEIIDSMPPYISKLLHYICLNIQQFTTRYSATFAINEENYKYKALSKFLCYDDCDLFKLELLHQLFPNLTSIAIERNSLTKEVMHKILEFLKQIKSNDNFDEVALNNIVFQSPISPSISFGNIENKYIESFKKLDWIIEIEKKEKRVIIKKKLKRKKSVHKRDASTNVLSSKNIFRKTDQYELADGFDAITDHEDKD